MMRPPPSSALRTIETKSNESTDIDPIKTFALKLKKIATSHLHLGASNCGDAKKFDLLHPSVVFQRDTWEDFIKLEEKKLNETNDTKSPRWLYEEVVKAVTAMAFGCGNCTESASIILIEALLNGIENSILHSKYERLLEAQFMNLLY